MITPLHNAQLQSDLDTNGFRVVNITSGDIPQNAQNGIYTFALTDAGKHVFHDSATPHTWTIPAKIGRAHV